MKKLQFLALVALFTTTSIAGTFTDRVKDLQVYEDRVRVYIGGGYGTCGERDGWFGWSTSHERHSDWLSLVLTAKTSNKPISFYDSQNSCGGPVDIVGVEGVFLPDAP